jgi:RecG-like helicase
MSDLAADPEIPAADDVALQFDRALSPLRRLVAFARVRPADVRFFDANARRWLAEAGKLAPEPAVAEALGALDVALQGWADEDGRPAIVDAFYAELARLDALLGLPLPPRRRPPPRRPSSGERPVRPTPSAPEAEARPERRGSRASSEGRDRHPQPAARPPEPKPPPRPPEPPRPILLESRIAELGLSSEIGAALAGFGVESVSDLHALVPESWETLQPIHGAGRELPAGRVAVGGRVKRRWSVCTADGRVDWVTIQGAGLVTAQWTSDTPDGLRRAWLAELAPDARVQLAGRWDAEAGVLRDAEPVQDDGRASVRLGAYGAVDGRWIRLAVRRGASGLARLRDPLPADLLARTSQLPLGEALTDLHLKGNARPEARRRLAFEEALLVQVGLAWGRFAQRERGIAHPLQHGLVGRIIAAAGESLTDVQANAFEDIKRDLRRSAPMMRVLEGPPGSGRGWLAFLAAVHVADARSQVLVVCPDATAADQRLALLEPMLRDTGLVARSVAGEVPRATKDALRRGEIHLLFGGPELLSQDLELRRLGLIVAFERPPYGETIRRLADGKAGRPDLLIVPSGAVLPATVAAAWPHLDVTQMDAPRRSRPYVEVGRSAQRSELYAKLHAAAQRREQSLVVFPLAEGVDAIDLRDALRLVRALETDALAGLRVGLFHGSMPREDRARVYDDFRHHRLDVLVATAAVEDGPGIPRLTHLLVEAADTESPRRLRNLLAGLVGRPWAGLIVGDDVSDADVQRLEGLRKSERLGDSVARLDDPRLEPPVPQWRWVDLSGEPEPWWAGRRAALEWLSDDPGLRRTPEVARWVRERWSDWFGGADDEPESESDGAEESGWPCPIPDAPSAGGAGGKRRKRRKKKR